MNIREFAMWLLLVPAFTAFILVLAPIETWLKLTIMGGVIGCGFGFTVIVAFNIGRRKRATRRRYPRQPNKEIA